MTGELSSQPITNRYFGTLIHPYFVATNLNSEDMMFGEDEGGFGSDAFTGTYNQTFSGNEKQINYRSDSIDNEDGNYAAEDHYEKETGAPTYIYQKMHHYGEKIFFREFSLTLIDSNTSIFPESIPETGLPLIIIIPLIVGVIALIIIVFLKRKKIKILYFPKEQRRPETQHFGIE